MPFRIIFLKQIFFVLISLFLLSSFPLKALADDDVVSVPANDSFAQISAPSSDAVLTPDTPPAQPSSPPDSAESAQDPAEPTQDPAESTESSKVTPTDDTVAEVSDFNSDATLASETDPVQPESTEDSLSTQESTALTTDSTLTIEDPVPTPTELISTATSTESILISTSTPTETTSTSTLTSTSITEDSASTSVAPTESNLVLTSAESLSTSTDSVATTTGLMATSAEDFISEIISTTAATSTEILTPEILEQLTPNGKIIIVSSPDGYDDEASPITDVLVRIEIPEIFKIGQENQIRIKWKNNENQEIQFTTYDEDGNGYIDHVEWIVPHLSTQTFEIIYISKALRLEADKNAIEDIYDIVKSHDVSQSATIEVYTVDGQLIATFPNIDHDGKYRISLANLQTPTDVFDLKIIGNVDIDQIIDPPANAYWVGGSGNWSDDTNHWAISSGGAPGSGNLPDATSNVFFDASSGAASSVVTIDTAATVGSFTINGYTG